jgi:hypothetical protein
MSCAELYPFFTPNPIHPIPLNIKYTVIWYCTSTSCNSMNLRYLLNLHSSTSNHKRRSIEMSGNGKWKRDRNWKYGTPTRTYQLVRKIPLRVFNLFCLHARISLWPGISSLNLIIFSFVRYLTIHHFYKHASPSLSSLFFLSPTVPSYLTHASHFPLSLASPICPVVSNVTRPTPRTLA